MRLPFNCLPRWPTRCDNAKDYSLITCEDCAPEPYPSAVSRDRRPEQQGLRLEIWMTIAGGAATRLGICPFFLLGGETA